MYIVAQINGIGDSSDNIGAIRVLFSICDSHHWYWSHDKLQCTRVSNLSLESSMYWVTATRVIIHTLEFVARITHILKSRRFERPMKHTRIRCSSFELVARIAVTKVRRLHLTTTNFEFQHITVLYRTYSPWHRRFVLSLFLATRATNWWQYSRAMY